MENLYESIMLSVSKELKKLLNNFYLIEGVESVISLSDVRKLLEPFGWTYKRGSGDSFKFSKDETIVYGHLKHGNSKDENRKVDVCSLDIIRTKIIEDFKKDGDLTLIKSIPWNVWRLPNPLNRELSNIDPETGKEKVILNKGQQLILLKIKKLINNANELYKDATLIKIVDNDINSAYILMVIDKKFNKPIYNTCRDLNDRRPLLKDWSYDFKKINRFYYFGKDNMRTLKTNYRKVLNNGQLEKNISLTESLCVNFY